MDPTERMFRQLRCLAPALVAEARAHLRDPAGLAQAVGRLMTDPLTTLIHLIEGEPSTNTRDGVELDTAPAVAEGIWLLAHAVQIAVHEAPVLGVTIGRLSALTHESPAETDAIKGASKDIAELLASDGRPGDAPASIALHRRLRTMCLLPDPRH